MIPHDIQNKILSWLPQIILPAHSWLPIHSPLWLPSICVRNLSAYRPWLILQFSIGSSTDLALFSKFQLNYFFLREPSLTNALLWTFITFVFLVLGHSQTVLEGYSQFIVWGSLSIVLRGPGIAGRSTSGLLQAKHALQQPIGLAPCSHNLCFNICLHY